MVYRFVLRRPAQEVEDFCVLEWHREEGQAYEPGDLLVEVETQKSIIEVRSSARGTLRLILCEPGSWKSFGDPIALVSDTPDEPVPSGTAESLATLEGALHVG